MYSNDSGGTQRSRTEFTYHDVVDDDTSPILAGNDVLPVLAGIEARVATRRGSRVRRLTEKAAVMADSPPAGTSRAPATRVKDHLTCNGPQNGGNIPKTPPVHPISEPSDSMDTHTTHANNTRMPLPVDTAERPVDVDTTLLAQWNLGIDMSAELRGKYTDDPFFQIILEKPSEFRK